MIGKRKCAGYGYNLTLDGSRTADQLPTSNVKLINYSNDTCCLLGGIFRREPVRAILHGSFEID